MNVFFRLALKSLFNRRETALLTLLSLSLSVALLLSVEKIKQAADEGFNQSISQVDLIVGGRSGPTNLLLYTVFNIGSATNNVSWETFEHFRQHPAVEWTVPYSLGDSHQGFRVVATNEDFFKFYRFHGSQQPQFVQGEPFHQIWDVVIGSEVAKTLQYQLGQKVIIAHGVTRGQGIIMHDNKPFAVKGVLKPTGTPIDRSLYITLAGMEALHIDWVNGAMPTEKTSVSAEQIKPEDLKIKTITSFFLRTKSRIETLRLQREINEYKEEPLLAIIPGVVLAELWRGLGYIEKSFRLTSWMVVVIGLISMLVALLTSLNERRREMSILRALGATPMRITLLLVFESTLLAFLGTVIGYLLHFIAFWILRNWLESEFGLVLFHQALSLPELLYLCAVITAGFLIGLVPGWRARQQSLKDGLSVRI